MEKYEIELTRLERQIVLYKYFNSPRIKGKINSKELYGIPVSTIYRDSGNDLDICDLNAFYEFLSEKYTLFMHYSL